MAARPTSTRTKHAGRASSPRPPVGAPRKLNSAVARRYERREVWDVGRDEWGDETRTRRVEDVDEPSRVTEGHWSEPEVAEARGVAEALQREHNAMLGAGNFGVAYLARGRGGALPRVVKMPAAHNMHGQPWSRDEQRHNILHEAGVANELSALGHAAVPRGLYTEWGGGTPAFVREYGEPLAAITPAEYGALEADLVSVERDRGWRVHDELQLYRRPDGGVFVADVGLWEAPPPTPRRAWSRLDSSLHHLLEDVQRKYLAGLAVRDPGPNPPSARYAYTLRVPVATLPMLLDDASRVAEALDDSRSEGPSRYEGKYGDHQRRDDARAADDYLWDLASRDALGVPTPGYARAFEPMARELLDAAGADAGAGAKKNGRPRRR